MSRPRVAFFDFTGCEGCQLTVVDSLQKHPNLLNAVEIVQFREAMSEKSDTYQIAFVEGSFSRPEDEQRLLAIRQNAEMVFALGACAHLGGVNSQRNWGSQQEIKHYVYGDFGKKFLSEGAKPVSAFVEIDGFVPGCPIDGEEFIRFVTALLQGRQPKLPNYPICIECRLQENNCLLARGQPCLGPITRAGCGAICTTHGVGCDGCRGTISNPNLNGLEVAFSEHGLTRDLLKEKRKIYQSYIMLEGEKSDNGKHPH